MCFGGGGGGVEYVPVYQEAYVNPVANTDDGQVQAESNKAKQYYLNRQGQEDNNQTLGNLGNASTMTRTMF